MAFSCQKTPKIPQAKVLMLQGSVTVVRKKLSAPCTKGLLLLSGDRVVTAAGSAAVLELGGDFAVVELQENAELLITDYAGEHKIINVPKGNIWAKVSKLQPQHHAELITPLTVAGIRGTKFHTFTMGEYFGTCFCDGAVEYSVSSSGHEGYHNTDNLVVTRGNKTISFNPAVLEKETGINHDHSVIAGSPLGNQDASGHAAKIMAFLDRRFAE